MIEAELRRNDGDGAGTGAVEILHSKELKGCRNVPARSAELTEAHNATFANPRIAERHGLLDAVIEPADTRHALCRSLRAVIGKRDEPPDKRNGNVPL